MKEYECEKCGKKFNKKSNYDNHKNRKVPCDQILLNNNIIAKKKDDNVNIKSDDKTNHINSIDDTQKETLLLKNDCGDIINTKNMQRYLNELKCIYCNKKYSKKSNVMYHIKHNCKKVKEIEDQKQAIFIKLTEEKEKEDNEIKNLKKVVCELEKELKKTQNIISNNNCNTILSIISIVTIIPLININNNQQNVVLVDYNKEDLSKIDKKEILAIMKRGFQAPVELTRTIHCNPKYPEFHNVFIPKINEKNGMVHIKDKWNLIDKNELSDDMYHRKRDFIIQNLEHYIDQLDEFKIKSLKRWLNTTDDDNEAIINKKEISKMCYMKIEL